MDNDFLFVLSPDDFACKADEERRRLEYELQQQMKPLAEYVKDRLRRGYSRIPYRCEKQGGDCLFDDGMSCRWVVVERLVELYRRNGWVITADNRIAFGATLIFVPRSDAGRR